MKWGLFGGTFDPIHFGHLRAAQELVTLLDLDRVIFIPAALPPHKSARIITPFEHRLQMVRLAIAGNEFFSFSDVESLRPGKSYSIDTVQYFLDSHDARLELYFITGQDAFDAITTWREWEKLLSLCHFVVITRPGYDNRGLDRIFPENFASRFLYDQALLGYRGPGGCALYFRDVTFLDISSSLIRQNIKAGRSVRYLTPDSVRHYIDEHVLYAAE
ncbi:MAG: nicotinate-nucleotide adenylyltransferase [Deltaproteobacteria bacterium]